MGNFYGVFPGSEVSIYSSVSLHGQDSLRCLESVERHVDSVILIPVEYIIDSTR